MQHTTGAIDPRQPVIIGVGQLTNRGDAGQVSAEPVELMAEVLRVAEADSAARSGQVAGRVQSISVVPVVSWRYQDPASLVAERWGARPRETVHGGFGGNMPLTYLNRAARLIQAGDLDVAAVVGGESWRTRSRLRRDDRRPEWTVQDDTVAPTVMVNPDATFSHDAEHAMGLFMPTQMYPLFESAIRAAAGRGFDEHRTWIAEWWAGFSQVAATNPYAWRRDAFTPAEIATVSAENRWVGWPYTKRMVSNPDVDMAAGLIVASAEAATSLGVPRDRWVFVHSGTDGVDRTCSERTDFTSSRSVRIAGRRAMELAGVEPDTVDHLDLYSCFPSAVSIAAAELGIGLDRELTVYGGLCFAGGPWNNPVSHALAAMCDRLREAGGTGLVTGNGGNITKHSFGVLAMNPPSAGFCYDHPQAEIDEVPGRRVSTDHTGGVTIETYAVMHDRDGSPQRAHAACLTPEGARRWAATEDAGVIAELLSSEGCGRRAHVSEDGTLSLTHL